MRAVPILPIYKGSFICYEELPKTPTDLHLGQKLFSKEYV
jgi:hypothetical protein